MDPEDLAKACDKLRVEVLCSEDAVGVHPQATEYYLLALSALEQAKRFAMLAHYALIAGPRR
jgi:hypothetical protein